MRTRTSVRAAALGAATAMIITGCGSDGGTADDDGGVSPAEAELTIVTGVYPLEWLAQEIGGETTAVVQLTEPGAEPHDLELTGRQIAEVSEADLAFYVEGLQPAVDEAVAQEAADSSLDVADVVSLRPVDDGGEDEDDHGHDHDHDHEDDHGHEEDEEDGHDHDHGDFDPHFWLDVELMSETAEALAERMGEIDPDRADTYRAEAERVGGELAALGTEYEDGLGSCEHREVVVGHTAFTYLTDRYDLEQIGVSGVDPDTEPSPAQIAAIADTVNERDITTIFTEPLMPAATADTIAAETGAQVEVLDPLEGVTEQSPGDDYPSIMRGNLEALSTALNCE
ncbi:metal ABC transporter substrate-binding protein [Nocardiopsis sp. MG754419]|uniref:metal ABC transporter substrate-binding protein n=1 Tax=Nocardiopsis sp. MG754419 TaxID=2259865 RepID=UPI001BADF47D|nr:metal ABC transporter substrate-binding protein [Nocardiopsis sp. MG754419]MBR8744624.1 zinc ABC transporter substrate-binding protein [Nocardiopsis sp. MG754419]